MSQEPLIAKGREILVGNNKATVEAIEKTGVRILLSGRDKSFVVPFDVVEKSLDDAKK